MSDDANPAPQAGGAAGTTDNDSTSATGTSGTGTRGSADTFANVSAGASESQDATTHAPRHRVLVVDDEPEVLNALRRHLRQEFDVLLAHDADEAMELLSRETVQVVISDERMPRQRGAQFLGRLRERFPDVTRLLLTAYADIDAVIQAVNLGHIYRYIPKPWDAVEIRTIVREAAERYRLAEENRLLLDQLRQANEALEQRVRERTAQLQAANEELRGSEQRYRKIIENISDPVMLVDLQGFILSVNPAFVRVTGFSVAEAVGQHFHLLGSNRNTEEFREGVQRELLEAGYWRGNVWNRRKNGEVYIQRLTLSTVCNDDGQGLYRVAVYSDLSAELRELEQAKFQAHHDALTGLPNRVLLHERLAEAIRETRRQSDRQVGVLFIDLDGFKPINDRHGHELGDAVLQLVAERLRKCTRDSDTVARLGGDEFVVVLRQIGRPEHAAQVAQKVLDGFQRPFQAEGIELSVGASIGIAIWPHHGEDARNLPRCADAAMYSVKQGGRPAYRFFGDLPPE